MGSAASSSQYAATSTAPPSPIAASASILAVAKKTRDRALVKHHLKFNKVLATDALDKLNVQHKDGMGTPTQLCTILHSLGIDCTSSDLVVFLESVGSFCDSDGRYSWFELVSFLQPHSHFESTCTLLDWHMQSYGRSVSAAAAPVQGSLLPNVRSVSAPSTSSPAKPLPDTSATANTKPQGAPKEPRRHQCWGVQYLICNSNFRDQEGKALSKGRWAAQISHASVKATWLFRDKHTMPLYVEALDMKTIIYKSKKTDFDTLVKTVAGLGIDYVIWQEQPEFQDAVLAIEPLSLEGPEASLADNVRETLRPLVSLF